MPDDQFKKSMWDNNVNQPTDRYGPCPHCRAPKSKIYYGWHGVYYDLCCPRGHDWSYDFPRRKEVA